MKLVSCSECFKPYETRFTSVVAGKRVCHECKKPKKRGEK